MRQASLHAELLARFAAYVAEPSRRNKVQLDEIVLIYLRVDPQECLALLHAHGGGALVDDPKSSISAVAQIDLDDISAVFRIARETDGRAGDAMIEAAFRRKAEDNPEEAFTYLKYLPSDLLGPLGEELARSWGGKDPAAAARAFNTLSPTWRWGMTVYTAVSKWAATDLDAAYDFVTSGEMKLPIFANQKLVQTKMAFVANLLRTDPRYVVRIEDAHMDLLTPQDRVRVEVRKNPERALELIAGLPTAKEQVNAARLLLENDENLSAAQVFQIAKYVPDSMGALSLLRNTAARAVSKSDSPYTLADDQSDPYVHTASVAGLLDGIARKRGLDGVISAIQHGQSVADPAWMDAASTLIYSGSSAVQSPPNWKSLPEDTKNALNNYVAEHWPADKAERFAAKLK